LDGEVKKVSAGSAHFRIAAVCEILSETYRSVLLQPPPGLHSPELLFSLRLTAN
jgi:hypothetical protein